MKELFTLLLFVLISIEAKAETITWGNYNGNKVSDLEGVGMNKAASYSVASFVPGDGALGGSTLEALSQMEVGESVESSFTLALPTKNDLPDSRLKTTKVLRHQTPM